MRRARIWGSHHKPDDGKCPLFCREPTESSHLLRDHLGGPSVYLSSLKPHSTLGREHDWTLNLRQRREV